MGKEIVIFFLLILMTKQLFWCYTKGGVNKKTRRKMKHLAIEAVFTAILLYV